jgi:hypothetical protein
MQSLTPSMNFALGCIEVFAPTATRGEKMINRRNFHSHCLIIWFGIGYKGLPLFFWPRAFFLGISSSIERWGFRKSN